MNVIADVAGQYEALIRLVKKLPRGPLVFLGDMVDRGPDSWKVIEFAMDHLAVMGNHEHMMLDFCLHDGSAQVYAPECWFMNGGYETIKSYGADPLAPKIPQEHLDWISGLPQFIETDQVFLSHAMDAGDKFDLMWNRQEPLKKGKLQICGHNSHWGLRYFNRDDGRPYAICLDDSRKHQLTALHLPSMQIFQEST